MVIEEFLDIEFYLAQKEITNEPVWLNKIENIESKYKWELAEKNSILIVFENLEIVSNFKIKEDLYFQVEAVIEDYFLRPSERGLTFSSKELEKKLLKLGFYRKSQKGSHVQLKKEGHKIKVTIPFHNKDLKKGTLRSILKQSGITVDQLLAL
jgi:predicted RNA binding protein YcfA (HicA-like mRNA interferase family)